MNIPLPSVPRAPGLPESTTARTRLQDLIVRKRFTQQHQTCDQRITFDNTPAGSLPTLAVISGSGTTFIVNLYDIHEPTVALFLQFVSIEVLAPFAGKLTESSSYVSGVDVLLGFSGFLTPISRGARVPVSFSSPAPLPPASPSVGSAFPTCITAGGATSHSQDIVSFYRQHRRVLYEWAQLGLASFKMLRRLRARGKHIGTARVDAERYQAWPQLFVHYKGVKDADADLIDTMT
ncbi:hypothetical protein D9619_009811 [Psilocybe cf. subviscida]|uniref:Uncharacterized protein n=1 Tax=Psilocybe cf. subviscida TaxID=2480587 RepID=A0A8H5BM69_9AGAR|nr:hypothetical protein D9619_009811 [Psilocybe cf. subviscida]